MEFTGPPQVARLKGLRIVVDASHNRWGDLTDAATVESYVEMDTTTADQGGILIDPVILP